MKSHPRTQNARKLISATFSSFMCFDSTRSNHTDFKSGGARKSEDIHQEFVRTVLSRKST
jgi:hypothetical protein